MTPEQRLGFSRQVDTRTPSGMLNPYLSLTEVELVDLRNKWLAELNRIPDGLQLTGDSRGGSSFSRQRPSVDTCHKTLSLITAALQVKDPDKYGNSCNETFIGFNGNTAASGT